MVGYTAGSVFLFLVEYACDESSEFVSDVPFRLQLLFEYLEDLEVVSVGLS